MDTESYYRDYSGFVVNRKRKNKKKRKQNLTLNTNANSDNSLNDDANNVESTADSNCTDIEDDEMIMTNGTNEKYRVSVDGEMKAPPQCTSTEDDRLEANDLNNGITSSQFNPNKINLKTQMNYEHIEINESEVEVLPMPKVIAAQSLGSKLTPEVSVERPLAFNNRALSRDSATYELEKFEKNALIIFNQENIEGHKPRLGTERDVQSLITTFSRYGFEVTERKDLSKDDLFKELKLFSDRDFTDYGCVAVAVLTHGSNNGLLRAKDQQYSETEIVNHFKTHDKPTLVTKPKLIIIQACRGTKIMAGVPVMLSGKIRKDLDEDLEPYYLPAESDLLLLHSSYAGSASHRDELHGSWFIQSLCSKIDQLSVTHDMESIITEVKREVAIDRYHEEYNRRTFEMDINKQMPVTTSTLIRKLYLKKFGDATPTDSVSKNITLSSQFDALDNLAPLTPLLTPTEACMCYLNHFTYIRDCLRYYLEDNPNDETALSYLELSNTFVDENKFNKSKETMAKAMCKHLIKYAKNSQYYKYLYFDKHQS